MLRHWTQQIRIGILVNTQDKDKTFSQKISEWSPFRESLTDPIGAPAMIGRDYRPPKCRFFSTESSPASDEERERRRMSDIVGYRGSEKR